MRCGTTTRTSATAIESPSAATNPTDRLSKPPARLAEGSKGLLDTGLFQKDHELLFEGGPTIIRIVDRRNDLRGWGSARPPVDRQSRGIGRLADAHLRHGGLSV